MSEYVEKSVDVHLVKIMALLNGKTGTGKSYTGLEFSKITKEKTNLLVKRGHENIKYLMPFTPFYYFDFENERGKVFMDRFNVNYINGTKHFGDVATRNWEKLIDAIRQLQNDTPNGGTFFFDSASRVSPWIQGVAEQYLVGKFGSAWDKRNNMWEAQLLKILGLGKQHVFFSSRDVNVWKDGKPSEDGETKEACWKELPFLVDFIVDCHKIIKKNGNKKTIEFQHYVRKRRGDAEEFWIKDTNALKLLAAMFPNKNR